MLLQNNEEKNEPLQLHLPVFWVYMLYCKNGAYYTGYAKDLIQRYRAHTKGRASKYTRSFPAVFVAAVWPIFGDKGVALQVEAFVKKMNKKEKEILIKNPLLLESTIFESGKFFKQL